MNVVLETLFLRRPKIEYVSPPICPVNFSASGVAFIEQSFNEDEFCPMHVNGNFLGFGQPADGLAYNVYEASTQSGILTNVLSGLQTGFAAVFSPGTYWVTANLPNGGETLPGPVTVAPGSLYSIVALVPGTVLNLYKNGAKLVVFSGTIVEATRTSWMLATKITTDGESPLVTSCGPVLVPAAPVPPPPPPPPPCPGPDWATGFAYGQPLCLRCEGVNPDGVPNCSGGLLPPSASFNATCQLIGGSPGNYIINSEGFVVTSYTGPNATAQLTLSNLISGSLFSDQNFVLVTQDGAQIFEVGRPTVGSSGPILNGTNVYTFPISAGVNSVIKVTIEQGVQSNSLFVMQGSFKNIC